MSEEQAEYVTSYKVADTNKYAGFWMRFWAFLIDLVVIFSINGILLSPLKFINNGAVIEIGYWSLTGILGGLVFYLYFLLMTRFFGQTFGKMILGLKVVRSDYEPLKWSDLIFREVVGRFIQRIFFILMFLYLVVAFNKDKQGIHDMIGNTKVVFEK